MLVRDLILVCVVVLVSAFSGINFILSPCSNINCDNCNPCSCGTEKYMKKDEVEVINVDKFDEECANHMNESKSNGYCSGFKYVYNPFKETTRRKRVLPACVKCAQCLAIAAEVRKIFDKIIQSNVCNPHLEPVAAKAQVNQQFTEDFCQRTFTSHDLRVCNGEAMFIKSGECGSHIRTEFDGQWPSMLKNMCSLFVKQLDAASKYNAFHQYQMRLKSVDEVLCRGDGVFRECKNLEIAGYKATEALNSTSKQLPTVWMSCFF